MAEAQNIDEAMYAQAVQIATQLLRPTDRDLPERQFWDLLSEQIERAYRGLQVARMDLDGDLYINPDRPFPSSAT